MFNIPSFLNFRERVSTRNVARYIYSTTPNSATLTNNELMCARFGADLVSEISMEWILAGDPIQKAAISFMMRKRQ